MMTCIMSLTPHTCINMSPIPSHPIPVHFYSLLFCEGFGVYVYGLVDSVEAGVELARTVLYSGKAIETLDKWIAVTQKLTASA